MRVLFATAELAPLVKVGGLGDFSAGFTRALTGQGIEVDIVLPDYGGITLDETARHELDLPGWCSPGLMRVGAVDGAPLSLASIPGLARPNPYLDADGRSWPDNDRRFLGFSAAVAFWADRTRPDVLHLNDWHTAATLAFLAEPPPSVLTVHNLAYQGSTTADWLDRLPHHRDRYRIGQETNPLAGGIALADAVVAVSPTFATETLPPHHGFGLAHLLAERGQSYLGIMNGIDAGYWDPATDPHLELRYEIETHGEKAKLKTALARDFGMPETDGPLVGMVTRLTDQKGVDMALEMLPVLEREGATMILLGSGERLLAEAATDAARRHPGRFVFRDGYDETLAHRIFGASDLYLMPSRFEPAGLTQMQAMRYGSIPVVTDVGGLHDTVTDADADPEGGTGFVAASVTVADVEEALGRAIRAWRNPERREEIIRRGMSADWSWDRPSRQYGELYQKITSAR